MSVEHLYIHVPFCRSICYYCDFCHVVYNENLVNKWLDKFEEEISNYKEQYKTIYIGGGTPTSLNCIQLERLLSLIEPLSNNVIEYTIEVNPESIDIEKINLLNKYHINRISMGLQTSDNNLLKSLNRKHTYNDVKEKIELLKQNRINNISLDLMYSLPNQSFDSFKKSLEDTIALEPNHISIYSLTIEQNTVFGKKGFKTLDSDIEADMYEYAIKYLEDNGYVQYEVSNFAIKGYESKHNLGYWHYDDYDGVSCGSSGKSNHQRYDITRNLNKYLTEGPIKDEIIKLSKKDEMFENIMMSLRLKEGLDINEFIKRYGVDPIKEYSNAIKKNNLIVSNGHLICNNLEILNNVLIDFMD